MILTDCGIFTEESDVETLLTNLKVRSPSAFARIPRVALERMRQNLLDAVREPITQPLQPDPFLTDTWQDYYRSTPPGIMPSGATTTYNVGIQRRCFYVKANAIGPKVRYSYFDKELSEFENMSSSELQILIEKTERDPTSTFRKYKNANQGMTRLPSKTRISRLAIMYAYKEYKVGGSHPIISLLRKLQDYGLNGNCVAMLIQGFTLDVNVQRSVDVADIALFDCNGLEVGNPYISPDLVEPVFYKIMSDKESERMYFKARTHYDKLVEDPMHTPKSLSKIRSAYIDDENQVWLKLGSGNEIIFTENREFIKAPRYFDIGFYVRCIPGETSKLVAKKFTRHVVKSSASIQGMRLILEDGKEELAAFIRCKYTRNFVAVPLKYLYFPRKAKRTHETTEAKWQRNLKSIRQGLNPLV